MSDTSDLSLDLETEDLIHEEADENQVEGEAGDEGEEGLQNETEVQNDAGRDGSKEGLDTRSSRANHTVRAARERAQAAERRALEAEARAASLQTQIQQALARPDPALLARQQQEEAARLEMMAPHEQMQYLMQKQAKMQEQALLNVQRQTADTLDKIQFDALQASNSVAKKFASQVEKVVAEQAANGFQVKRQEALAYVIGKAVLAKGSTAAKTQKAAAAARVSGATVSRGGAGGDVRADRRGAARSGSVDERYAHLKGVSI